MRRGAIFSFDAGFALVMVIVLLGIAVTSYEVSQDDTGITQTLRNQANDRAVTGFYLGESGRENIGSSFSEFGECATIYFYDPALTPRGKTPPFKQNFCETR